MAMREKRKRRKEGECECIHVSVWKKTERRIGVRVGVMWRVFTPSSFSIYSPFLPLYILSLIFSLYPQLLSIHASAYVSFSSTFYSSVPTFLTVLLHHLSPSTPLSLFSLHPLSNSFSISSASIYSSFCLFSFPFSSTFYSSVPIPLPPSQSHISIYQFLLPLLRLPLFLISSLLPILSPYPTCHPPLP